MVFQAYALFPNLTVAQNIGFGLKVAGVPKAEVDGARRRDAGADQPAAARRPLSLPAFRRPAAARGAGPRAGAASRRCCCSTSRCRRSTPRSACRCATRSAPSRRQLGITTIFVTHDQEEALSMSDRIVVMYGGKAEQVGTPFEIYNRPATKFVANFVGTLNVLEGTVTDAGDRRGAHRRRQMSLMKQSLNGAKAGDTLSLALRPEAISLGKQPGRDASHRRHDLARSLPRLGDPGARRPRQGRRVARHVQQPRHAAAQRSATRPRSASRPPTCWCCTRLRRAPVAPRASREPGPSASWLTRPIVSQRRARLRRIARGNFA